MNDETVDLMAPYLNYQNYTLEAALSSCGQVAGLLSWTIAMRDFYKVNSSFITKGGSYITVGYISLPVIYIFLVIYDPQ